MGALTTFSSPNGRATSTDGSGIGKISAPPSLQTSVGWVVTLSPEGFEAKSCEARKRCELHDNSGGGGEERAPRGDRKMYRQTTFLKRVWKPLRRRANILETAEKRLNYVSNIQSLSGSNLSF